MRGDQTVTTRKATAEEAKKYGIKTVLEEIEWFVDSTVPSNPSVGLNSNGLQINAMAAAKLECKKGDTVQIGFNSAGNRLVLKKAESGIKLRESFGKCGSVCVVNKRLVEWLEAKRAIRKRYVLQYDETAQVYFIQLEIATVEAETA